MPSSSSFRRLPIVLALLAGATSVHALFSQGTISDRDYQLTYTGYNDTTAFCTAFRAECVDYDLDCVVSQEGPTIYAWCGGVEKDTDGDTGSGPAYDFTELVCPETDGCSTAAEPVEPVSKYGTAASSASTVASTSAVSSTVKGKSASAASSESSVANTPPTGSSLTTSLASTATYAFASQASSQATLAYAKAAVSGSSSAAASTAASSSGSSDDISAASPTFGGAVLSLAAGVAGLILVALA
ncbi:hypothetical protein JCM8547_008492 [Rhodosporidiobolus lusitaniae]